MIIKKFSIISLVPPEKWPVVIPDKKDGAMYSLGEDYTLYFYGRSKQYGGERIFKLFVPEGFRTDLQSTPRFLWSFMRPDGNVRIAAVAHDACYRTAGFTIKEWLGCRLKYKIDLKHLHYKKIRLSRLASDQIYRDVYIQSTTGRTSRMKARLGYIALRLFGKISFGKEPPNETMI